MKRFIDIYTLRLVKENILYIIMFTLVFVIVVFFIPLTIKSNHDYAEKTRLLTEEIDQLTRKKTLLNSVDPQENSYLIQVLNSLIPTSEDYFSLISALENLSRKTGFAIVSYSLDLEKKAKDKIALNVKCEGTSNTFLKFLESYKYQGGRLITMDSITFTPGNFKTSLTLNFYNKDTKPLAQPKVIVFDKKKREKIKKIAEEMEVAVTGQSLENQASEIEYTTKTDPFSL